MKILFVSQLSPVASTGPNYSVPGRIEAQSHIDDVYWINLSEVKREEWMIKSYFHDSGEYSQLSLSSIEKNFPNIDVVVFEGFYFLKQVKLSRELTKRGIPYVIVPRSSLTRQALCNHSKYKKWIAHQLYFNKYCKNALAIQYLTIREFEDSGTKWNKNAIIIPNGIKIPDRLKTIFSKDKINAVFVGRLDIYQKGLDVLLEACKQVKDILRKNSFNLTLYGPQIIDYSRIESLINQYGINDFVKLGGEVLGKEKEDVLMKSDLFVLTSRFEGHPMGLIEALSYGLPVLVSPGANMAKEIDESNSGWICETQTNSVCEKLIEIVNSKQLFVEKGKQARQLATNYDWEKLSYAFHEKIIELLKK
jgi:glycosyltransferase involved in cell wall biosynthesis